VQRVLDQEPVESLDAYRAAGGGVGLERARAGTPAETIAIIADAGLRGRGGAGFPTGRKWQTVAEYESPVYAATVVANGAEGEPGSFKDRTLLRGNPYKVVEGALIAAHAIEAGKVMIAIKEEFSRSGIRLEQAIAEMRAAGWTQDLEVDLCRGPNSYLYGEETALLEVLDGREPFPRVAPPWRHGVDEIGDGAESAADLELAEPWGAGIAPPTLANNVETLSNVPSILANGADWFREYGTEESPGTILVTISGATQRAGVGELALGTTLRDAIEQIGGGVVPGHEIVAVISGVSNPFLPARELDTPLTYEAMRAAGSGLGAAGFIVLDDRDDLVSVAQGIAWFLAVESCGQCTPCKRDGLALADLLDRVRRSAATTFDLDAVADRVATVGDSARCALGRQQQDVIGSLLEQFPDALSHHVSRRVHETPRYPIAAIKDIVDGVATIEADQARKQPDWTYNAIDSGTWPAARIDERGEER
jgi:NADH-quinone oxidoreductase subunit F